MTSSMIFVDDNPTRERRKVKDKIRKIMTNVKKKGSEVKID